MAPAKIREAQFSDFNAVAELKLRWGANPDSPENWERLWRRNPALVESKFERPIGWVLEAQGTVVGYLGNISLKCWYGDRVLSAVTAHGFVMDKAYRALSLSLTAAFFRQKSVDLFVSTSAIPSVGKIALAFKSSPLPQPDYETILFWVLQPHPFAQAFMRKMTSGPILSRTGGALAAFALGTDKVFRRRWPRTSAVSFNLSEISPSDIGEEFEDLWRAKLKESPRLLTDRSAAALRWHFEVPGDRGSAQVICCHKDKELIGYALVRSDTDPENGLRKSTIADMVARNDDPAVVQALLVAAYKHTKRTGRHVLEVQGFPRGIREICSEWKPYRRKLPACPYYYKANDSVLHETLADPGAWYACPFDGDATLIRPSYASAAPNSSTEGKVQETQCELISNLS